MNNKIAKKKFNITSLVITLLLILSLFNSLGLLLFLIVILLQGLKDSQNSLKVINIVTFRSILNPGLAISIPQFGFLKWVILFVCAGRLIIDYFKISNKSKLNQVLFPVLIYLAYSALSSFLFSSLPIVALMKILSYGFIFIGVLIGIYNTLNDFDWITWLYKQLLLIVVFSVPLIPLDIGYLRNGWSFQGIVNHPNLFGIVIVLFMAINIVLLQLNKFKLQITGHFFNVLSFLLIWLTNARTSLISALILMLCFLLLSNLNYLKKGFRLILLSLVSIIILVSTDILLELKNFLFKGADDLLYSRGEQVSTLTESFNSNPLFGTGFAVPVLPYRSYVISTNFIVEPGNLLLSLLAYGGLIGFVLFNIYMVNIILSNKKNFQSLIFLPLATVLISMGEMVFFSSNNIGIWLYMFIGVYAFYDNDYKKLSN